ncbi:MAG: hypothetical protein JKY37_02660 [Nannocystaceae bacterium]|nr:hypothetical protein [Nannocystaceae bacterium]
MRTRSSRGVGWAFAALVWGPAFGCVGGGEGSGSGGGSEDSGGIQLATSTTEAHGDGAGRVEGSGGGGSQSSASPDGDAEGSEGSGLRYDVGVQEGPPTCPGASAYDFSTIWIANSPEGTVSKIDTRTGAELARYATGPEDNPDPSRTSVNLQGDVAVGNRGGSIASIAGRLADCVDADDDGEIRTSSGADNVLPWGEDECVRWHLDLPFSGDNHTGGPRAVAWDVGEPVQDICDPPAPRVWVGWRDMPNDTVILRRLDGATGETDAEVTVPEWDGRWGHGTYGGAVDGDNNFWALGTWSTLIRVDGVTLDVDRWDNSSHNAYGLALDAAGNPWLAGYDGRLTHFDVASETFVDHGNPGPSRLRGLAIDTDGFAWIAGNDSCSLVKFDVAAQTVADPGIPLPGCSSPVGVSIDVDGFVWVVDRDASEAYKVDPNTNDIDVIGGLINPYTYSDMTGAGLGLVFPPEG